MTSFYFILLAILEHWIEYCSHDFFEIFAQQVSAENQFTVNCIRWYVAPSGFEGMVTT